MHRFSLCCLVLLALAAPSLAAEPSAFKFKKATLDTKFRSEGVAVADINQDGKNDIVAGYVWYEAPDWKMHTVLDKAPESNPLGYSNSFCTFADDINGDGLPDILVVDAVVRGVLRDVLVLELLDGSRPVDVEHELVHRG